MPANHPVTQYAQRVVDGEITAGELVRLACKRHLSDLKTGKMRGLYFDPDAADHAIGFFRFLKHFEGEWAGVQFELEPWQQFIVGSLFGWKRPDGTRRFRTAYDEIARKNGKTTLAAGIGLYLFIADGEPGAQVYSAATARDQARITHKIATHMVKSSPALKKRVRIFRDNLSIEATASKYEPLSADYNTMDGLNVHGSIIDELHAHKSRGVWDVLDTATGARRQPLIFTITTAGTNQQGICYEQRDYAIQVLRGNVQDDSYFAYIATIDEDDDWQDESCWAKANPNLGISVKIDDLRRKAERAKQVPGLVNPFLNKHLNVWTQQTNRWLSLDLWDENTGLIDEENLLGRRSYGGLDLSSVSDITVWVLVFPHDDDAEMLDVLCRFWVPEAKLHDEHNKFRSQYQAWAREGFLQTTPGDAIDYGYVKAQILRDAIQFDLVDFNVDRLFQAHELMLALAEEGLTPVPMGQGFLSMATPTKELERRLLRRKIRHGGNPVLRWMADNVAVKQDAAGNLKPDKSSSQNKIDGIVALIMAIDRAMRHEDPKRSVYEDRGAIVL